MEANPGVAVTYAPWLLHDLVANRTEGTFYTQDGDALIHKGDHPALLDHLLRWSLFPEIAIYRRAALQSVMPRISNEAFYAFVHAAEFLGQGDILFRKEAFYVSVTRYFANEPQRDQTGMEQARHAWDRYRGGLEHILGIAKARLGDMARAAMVMRIQHLVAERMAVAVRLRMHAGSDDIENYFLASRVKALGYERLLPAPMAALSVRAALAFLAGDEELHRGITSLIYVGELAPDFRAYIQSRAKVPVRFEQQVPALDSLRDCLVCGRQLPKIDESKRQRLLEVNVKLLSDGDVFAKFPA